MQYLKMEYGSFMNDNILIIPVCFRGHSDFTPDNDSPVSIFANGNSVYISTQLGNAEAIGRVDRHWKIEIPKKIRRQARLTANDVVWYLADAGTMIITPLRFFLIAIRALYVQHKNCPTNPSYLPASTLRLN